MCGKERVVRGQATRDVTEKATSTLALAVVAVPRTNNDRQRYSSFQDSIPQTLQQTWRHLHRTFCILKPEDHPLT